MSWATLPVTRTSVAAARLPGRRSSGARDPPGFLLLISSGFAGYG
jgi:hypothetical protein